MLRSNFAFVNRILDVVQHNRSASVANGGSTAQSLRDPPTSSNMAWRDVLGSIQSRLTTPSSPHSEKSLRNVTWKSLFGWTTPDANEKPRETAWLDGLRGVAAFLVMTYHYHLAWWSPFGMEAPYGANEVAMDWWRLPFIRLWMCSGHAQVSTFFVLSGFVLSWSMLASIRQGRYEKIAQSLGSATFRRWMRLYLPCFAVAAFYAVCFYFHIIDIGGLTGIMERQPNFFAQMWDLFKSDAKFANPFDINRNQWTALHDYEATMWTIPYEFAGSILVFLTLLTVCRIRDYKRRSVITIGIALYACIDGRWAYWLFASGLCIADYVRQRGSFTKMTQDQSTRTTVAWSTAFVFGLYIAGLPEPSDTYPAVGYEIFMWLVPPQWKDIEGGGRFWWCWAGIILILSASHLRGVQRVFDNPVTRYLGRISYMLYLTHRTVLDMIGKPLKSVIFPLFGRDLVINQPPGTPLYTLLIYIILFGTLVPIAIFTAHWLQVFVDEPSVKFAKWVEGLFVDGPSHDRGTSVSSTATRGPGDEGVRLLSPDRDTLPLHQLPPQHEGARESQYPA